MFADDEIEGGLTKTRNGRFADQSRREADESQIQYWITENKYPRYRHLTACRSTLSFQYPRACLYTRLFIKRYSTIRNTFPLERATVLFHFCLESQAVDFFCHGLVVGLRTIVFHACLLLSQRHLKRSIVEIKGTTVALHSMLYLHRFNPIHLSHVPFDILHARLARHAVDVEDCLGSRTHRCTKIRS